MSNIKPKPKSTNNLTRAAIAALKRIKAKHGVIQKSAIERGVLMLETHLNAPQGRSI